MYSSISTSLQKFTWCHQYRTQPFPTLLTPKSIVWNFTGFAAKELTLIHSSTFFSVVLQDVHNFRKCLKKEVIDNSIKYKLEKVYRAFIYSSCTCFLSVYRALGNCHFLWLPATNLYIGEWIADSFSVFRVILFPFFCIVQDSAFCCCCCCWSNN